MVIYNFSRETKEIARYKKLRTFDSDICFIDCYHNINIIKFIGGKKYKKEILDMISSEKIVSISMLNKYLKDTFNLYAYSYVNIRTIYYYDIDIYNDDTFKKYYTLLDNMNINEIDNNKFSDLD